MSQSFKKLLLEQGLFISWGFALVATMGSLYFSEIVGYIPCELCWYQRIFMYPLVLILGIAVVKQDLFIAKYVWPLALIGGLISTYHYLQQKVTFFKDIGSSCGIIPCTTENINWFGFITIPFLAFIAFSLIAIIQFLLWRTTKERSV